MRQRLQESVDIRQIRLGRDLGSKGRHLARRLADICAERWERNRIWSQARAADGCSFRLPSVTFETAIADVQLLAGLDVACGRFFLLGNWNRTSSASGFVRQEQEYRGYHEGQKAS